MASIVQSKTRSGSYVVDFLSTDFVSGGYYIVYIDGVASATYPVALTNYGGTYWRFSAPLSPLPAIAAGDHVARIDRHANSFPNANIDTGANHSFSINVPEDPTNLSASDISVGDETGSLSWTAGAYNTSYEVRINGITVQSRTSYSSSNVANWDDVGSAGYTLQTSNPETGQSDFNFLDPDGINTWDVFALNKWDSIDDVVEGSFELSGGILPTPSPDDLITFPSERPDAYDPDFFWQPGEWTDPSTYVPGDWGAGYVATGGGRWGKNLVVAGNNKIYYESFS